MNETCATATKSSKVLDNSTRLVKNIEDDVAKAPYLKSKRNIGETTRLISNSVKKLSKCENSENELEIRNGVTCESTFNLGVHHVSQQFLEGDLKESCSSVTATDTGKQTNSRKNSTTTIQYDAEKLKVIGSVANHAFRVSELLAKKDKILGSKRGFDTDCEIEVNANCTSFSTQRSLDILSKKGELFGTLLKKENKSFALHEENRTMKNSSNDTSTSRSRSQPFETTASMSALCENVSSTAENQLGLISESLNCEHVHNTASHVKPQQNNALVKLENIDSFRAKDKIDNCLTLDTQLAVDLLSKKRQVLGISQSISSGDDGEVQRGDLNSKTPSHHLQEKQVYSPGARKQPINLEDFEKRHRLSPRKECHFDLDDVGTRSVESSNSDDSSLPQQSKLSLIPNCDENENPVRFRSSHFLSGNLIIPRTELLLDNEINVSELTMNTSIRIEDIEQRQFASNETSACHSINNLHPLNNDVTVEKSTKSEEISKHNSSKGCFLKVADKGENDEIGKSLVGLEIIGLDSRRVSPQSSISEMSLNGRLNASKDIQGMSKECSDEISQSKGSDRSREIGILNSCSISTLLSYDDTISNEIDKKQLFDALQEAKGLVSKYHKPGKSKDNDLSITSEEKSNNSQPKISHDAQCKLKNEDDSIFCSSFESDDQSDSAISYDISEVKETSKLNSESSLEEKKKADSKSELGCRSSETPSEVISVGENPFIDSTIDKVPPTSADGRDVQDTAIKVVLKNGDSPLATQDTGNFSNISDENLEQLSFPINKRQGEKELLVTSTKLIPKKNITCGLHEKSLKNETSIDSELVDDIFLESLSDNLHRKSSFSCTNSHEADLQNIELSASPPQKITGFDSDIIETPLSVATSGDIMTLKDAQVSNRSGAESSNYAIDLDEGGHRVQPYKLSTMTKETSGDVCNHVSQIQHKSTALSTVGLEESTEIHSSSLDTELSLGHARNTLLTPSCESSELSYKSLIAEGKRCEKKDNELKGSVSEGFHNGTSSYYDNQRVAKESLDLSDDIRKLGEHNKSIVERGPCFREGSSGLSRQMQNNENHDNTPIKDLSRQMQNNENHDNTPIKDRKLIFKDKTMTGEQPFASSCSPLQLQTTENYNNIPVIAKGSSIQFDLHDTFENNLMLEQQPLFKDEESNLYPQNKTESVLYKRRGHDAMEQNRHTSRFISQGRKGIWSKRQFRSIGIAAALILSCTVSIIVMSPRKTSKSLLLKDWAPSLAPSLELPIIDEGKQPSITLRPKFKDKTLSPSLVPPKPDKGNQSPLTTIYQTSSLSGIWVKVDSLRSNEAGDKAGCSVAMTIDGKRIVVGAMRHHKRTGVVRTYSLIEDGKTWSLIDELVGENIDDQFGFAVAMSSDGAKLAVGAPGYDLTEGESNEGQVYFYNIVMHINGDSGLWSEDKKIPGYESGGQLGASLIFDPVGYHVAIGAPKGSNRHGSVQVYMFAGDSMTRELYEVGKKIVGRNQSDLFGLSISLSATGKELAVGAPNGRYVNVYRYDLKANDWELTSYTNQMAVNKTNQFGFAVSISKDGTKLAVGEPGYDATKTEDNEGRVYLYSIGRHMDDSSDTWLEDHQISGYEKGGQLGYSVSFDRNDNESGYRLAIGAPCESNQTSSVIVYQIFTNDSLSEELIQVGERMQGSPYDRFGSSLSLIGKKIAIGAPNELETNAGYVTIHVLEEKEVKR